MAFKVEKKPADTRPKEPTQPKETVKPIVKAKDPVLAKSNANAAKTETTSVKPLRISPSAEAIARAQAKNNTGNSQKNPVAPKDLGSKTALSSKDAKLKADTQLIARVLDTQPKFAQFIAKQANAGQLSGKQVNDLAALAKRMQVKGKTDTQVVQELAKSMKGMNPSGNQVFLQEFAKGLKQNTVNNVKQFGIGGYEAGKQMVVGLGTAVRHPVTTARGIGQMVRTGAVSGMAELQLGGQALGVLPGNKGAAQSALKRQGNAAGQYLNNIAADPKKIGAVTANAMSAVLPLPGAKAAASLAAKAGTTAAGKAALAALDKAALKVGAVVDLGKGLSGKVASIVTGKDGKRYAVVQTSAGPVKVPAVDFASRSTTGGRALPNGVSEGFKSMYGVLDRMMPEGSAYPKVRTDVSNIIAKAEAAAKQNPAQAESILRRAQADIRNYYTKLDTPNGPIEGSANEIIFRTRQDAIAAAKIRAGIPEGAKPVQSWQVGPSEQKGNMSKGIQNPNQKGYKTSNDPSKGNWGTYEVYETTNPATGLVERRVIVTHTSDLNNPLRHVHAGSYDSELLASELFDERYDSIGADHHFTYQIKNEVAK